MYYGNKTVDDLSAKMANMSFICACMIVFFHATPAPLAGSFSWWICHLVGREGICMMAVPWFFISSGFFFAGHLGESVGWYRREVVKRIRSLVIPFYIWMVITLLFETAIWYVKVHVFNMQSKLSPFSLSQLLFVIKMLGVHPVEDIGVFWYMRCLFFMVLISPALYWLMRWKLMVLAVFASLFFVVSWYFKNGASKDFYFFFDRFVSIRGLVYFFIGILLRFRKANLIINRNVAICIFGFGMLLLIVDNSILLCYGVVWSGIFEAILVPFLIGGLFGLMPGRRFPKWITVSCFPIFLMHNIFLSLSSLGFKVIGMYGNAQYDLIMMFTRAFVAIISSIAVSTFIHRYHPRVSSIIFGGR